MSAPDSRSVGGKTFFRNGVLKASENDRAKAPAAGERDGFEAHRPEGEGACLVRTRRVVKQVTDELVN